MALTKFTINVQNVQALNDRPNANSGMTADQVKAVFDKAGEDFKEYVNDTLTDEVDILIASIESGVGLADGSVITIKLANGGVTTIKLADFSVTAAKIALGVITLAQVNLASFDTRYYTESEIDSQVALLETKSDLTTTRKLSATGDFTGTLNGYPIVAADPGISSIVSGLQTDVSRIQTNTQTTGSIVYPNNNLAEKWVFDLRSINEWDYTTANATFVKGVFAANDNNACWAIRALNSQSNENYTLEAQLYWSGGAEFRNQLGFTSAPAGTVETLGSQHRYIGLETATGFYYNDGAVVNALVAPGSMAVGWYTVTMTVRNDTAKTLIITIQPENSTAAQVFTYTGLPIIMNNIAMYSGNSINKIRNLKYMAYKSGAERILYPIIEGAKNNHVPFKLVVNGVNTYAHIPASYNPKIKNRVVIFAHGWGGTGAEIWTDSSKNSLVNALLYAGYVVVASDYTNNKSWGNAQSNIDTKDLLTAYKSYINVEDRPFIYMSSMGGMVTLNSITHGYINPKAVVGICPAINLQQIYTDNQFTPTIESAYGFSGSGAFAAATVGYRPLDASVSYFTKIPFKLWASYSDVTIYRTYNSDAFATFVNAAGGNVTIVTATGTHGSASHYDPAAVVDFFNTY